MKIAFSYFTFGKDEEIFNLSLLSTKRLIEKNPQHSFNIFVFDQDDCPLSSIPDGVIYERTSFPRGNNITGFPCIKGMLECYTKIAELGYDIIIKIDSDVFAKDLSYLPDTSFSAIGGNSWDSWYFKTKSFCGACYTLSRDTVLKMNEAFKNVFVKDKIKRWEKGTEDDAFSYLVHKTNTPPTFLNNYFKDYFIICKVPLILSKDRNKERQDAIIKIKGLLG